MLIDIITQTDFAAAIEASYHCPGAARVAGLVGHIRAQNPEGTLFLDAGDVLCGAPIANLTDGAPVIALLGQMGVDAMTLGNHEFDRGQAFLNDCIRRADFPILCANIVEKATGDRIPGTKPFVLLERAGLRIGVVGITTEYTPYMVTASSFLPYAAQSAVEACRSAIPAVRAAGADIVVLLAHVPFYIEEDGSATGELIDILSGIPPVDVCIGGHIPGD